MKGYKLTISQKNEINGRQWQTDCAFNPIEDKDGNFFIFEQEYPHAKELLGVASLPYVTFTAPVIDISTLINRP